MADIGAGAPRPSGWTLALVLTAFAMMALGLISATVVTYLAYDRDSDRVEQVAAENRSIAEEHAALGAKFAEQTRKLNEALAAARRAANPPRAPVPPKLGALEPYARNGFLVPRAIPAPLSRQPVVVRGEPGGYTVRWRTIALFASVRDPLTIWTRQAWPRTLRTFTAFGRRIHRLIGPSGVVYAWRSGSGTYAIVAREPADDVALALVGVMRRA